MKNALPTCLLVFGATGDLMGKKIVPSLWHLFEKKRLPEGFEVIGLSRRSLSAQDFRELVIDLIKKYVGEVPIGEASMFLEIFSFQRVTFESDADFEALALELEARDKKRGVANRLLYMAVPPEAFPQIFGHHAFGAIVQEGKSGDAHTRVIIEKPFGVDEKSAKELEEVLMQRFTEEQLYRADHYLAKPVLRNIARFRFSEAPMEHVWNSEHIASIHISTWEPIGVESRGSFYDPLGTLRDVGQNHLLEMLALITMEKPESDSVDAVRKARAEIIGKLQVPTEKELGGTSFRAQYKGYREIAGVRPDSETETFYRLSAYLDTPRWSGVPIMMEAGKRLPHWKTEVKVIFKDAKYRAEFIMRPVEEIRFAVGETDKKFPLEGAETTRQYVAEYARILMDASEGDQRLFVSKEEIENAWRFIDPIEATWKKSVIPLSFYAPDTNEAVSFADKD